MMIILFLIGALGLGRLALNSLRLTWHRFEAWALVILFGYYFGAWILVLACSLFGFKAGGAVSVVLMLSTWILPQTRHSAERSSLATPRQTWVWLAVTGTLSLLISYLMYRQILQPGPGGYTSEGDLPAHLSIMTDVAYATRFTWRFTLMAGTYLTYPFLLDFVSGMIVRWGGTLRFSILVTSIPLFLSLFQLLFFLGYRILKNVRAASLFTVIFLLNGSSGGFIAAISDFLHSHASFWTFFGTPSLDYTNSNIYQFRNIISDIVMPQRCFQVGLPIFCAALLLVWQLNPEMPPLSRRRVMLFVGILIGLLPLAHVHSFFMIFLVLLVLALFDREIASIREWSIALGTGLALALPQLVYQVFANPHIGFFHFQPGWVMSSEGYFPQYSHTKGLFLFILANFGILLPLVIVSYCYLGGYKVVRHLILLGVILFVASFLFIFQPVMWDNIKFLLYAFLFFCLGIAQYLSLLSRRRKWAWAPVTVLMAVSGVLALIWKGTELPPIYPYDAFKLAREVRQQLPVDALILTTYDHIDPVWVLAGHPVVEGETGYMYAYGLTGWPQIQKDVDAMYAGGPDAVRLLQKYRVQYVMVSRYERNYLSAVNEPFFGRNFPLIYYRDGVSIYQVRRASS
jgi:hypothetical protein